MLKTIAVTQLQAGMYLHKLSGSWINNPFWRRAFLLSQQEIDTLIESDVTHVIIDTNKGLDLDQAVTVSKASSNVQPLQPTPDNATSLTPNRMPKKNAQAEWARAKAICDSANEAIESMFQDVRMGRVVNVNSARALVNEISASVASSTDSLISLARLKTRDNYTYMHSVAVCAMMIALARELGFDEIQVYQAGFGGLLHDLGKAVMPLEVLNKPGKLTDDEYRIMQSHALEGYTLLAHSGISPDILDIVLHHHEKFDGTGYPDKLAGEQISLLSRMGAVCDVYDAITSTRPYKDGWEPAQSLKKMVAWQGHFDPRILQAFIKSIGIYPVGSLVKLESGRLGVVLEQTQGKLLTPKVKVFFATRPKGPITIDIIDLSTDQRDRIVSIEDSAKWGFKNLDDLWAYT